MWYFTWILGVLLASACLASSMPCGWNSTAM